MRFGTLVRLCAIALLAALLPVIVAAPAQAGPPTGDVNGLVSPGPGRIHVTGWALDPANQGVSVDIHVYVGGYGVNIGPANTYRPDVPANSPYAGDHHGFDKVVDIPLVGDYAWEVYAIDPSGPNNVLLESGRVTLAADTTAPETTITSAPSVATPTDVINVSFSASEPASTFQCHWDSAAWEACQSPTTTSLPPGEHTVQVRATDKAGNTDPTPASAVVVVSNYATQPLPGAGRAIKVGAVKKKSRLRINVDPDSPDSSYRVTIQRRTGKKWAKVRRVRTRGTTDVVVVNLPRGKYRVILPKQDLSPALTSSSVRLKR